MSLYSERALKTHNQEASCAISSSSAMLDSSGTASANISSSAFCLFSSFSPCSAMTLMQWAWTSCSCVWTRWLSSWALSMCRCALYKRSPRLVLVNSDPVNKKTQWRVDRIVERILLNPTHCKASWRISWKKQRYLCKVSGLILLLSGVCLKQYCNTTLLQSVSCIRNMSLYKVHSATHSRQS